MTKDGVWIQTTILEYDRYFPSLCKVLGVPEMAEDSRFKTLKESLKPENKRYQIELFEKIYATRTADEWITLIRDADIVVDRLNHFKNIHDDKQALQNEFISTHTLPNGDTCSITRPSARFDSMEVLPTTWGPKLGADTHEILYGIGLSDEEISELENQEIVR
jgi:crotonobetainyl-CoA:carnitine CoA-transferase CaiB-like acyl-CoA transferase